MENQETLYSMNDGSNGYHDLPGLSNSRLKLLKKDPVLFKRAMDHGWSEEEKTHHVEGDMIDKVLLDYAAFEQKYVLQTWETPSSEQQKAFAQAIVEGHDGSEAYRISYKAGNLKPDTIAKKAKELEISLGGYIAHLESVDDRIPYSAKDQEMLMGIQHNAMNNPMASKLLTHQNKTNHMVIQKELFGLPFKCEVDLLVDLRPKTPLVFNIDVKSTHSPLSQFPREYRMYGYHNQQALYERLIIEELNDPKIKVRTLCIAAQKNDPYNVLVFDIHADLLAEGWKQIEEGVELYKFHEENGYDFPKRTYLRGSEIINPYTPDQT